MICFKAAKSGTVEQGADTTVICWCTLGTKNREEVLDGNGSLVNDATME
jgi:hypothetical protein